MIMKLDHGLPQELIARLIQLGREPNLESIEFPKQVPDIGRYESVNRLWKGKWYEVGEHLPRDDLIALIKSLVIAEKQFRWIGGSVAAVIWLFRVFQRRYPAYEIELADWVLRNRGRNRYVPFGSACYATSYREWLQEQSAKQRLYIEHQEREERQRTEAAERKRAREAAHQARVLDSRRRAHRLTVYLRSLSLLPAEERLSRIASESIWPLEAIPTKLIPTDMGVIRNLNLEVRVKLIEKVDRRRGFWSRYKKMLCASMDT